MTTSRITAAEARALREGRPSALVDLASGLPLAMRADDLAAEVEALSAELAALRIESGAHAALLAATRADRDRLTAELAELAYLSKLVCDDFPTANGNLAALRWASKDRK